MREKIVKLGEYRRSAQGCVLCN